MLEYWNIGILGYTHYSIVPLFHHSILCSSIIPVLGREPHLRRIQSAILGFVSCNL